MIDTIIFDFGDVLMNLDKNATINELHKLNLNVSKESIKLAKNEIETGLVNEDVFISNLQLAIPGASEKQIREAWHAELVDFPLERLEFLQKLSHRYSLFLLSNMDSIRIARFEEIVGMTFARDFYQCFNKVYFSSEIGYTKPNKEAFEYVIKKHELQPKRTLFIDDQLHNIKQAELLGMYVWHIKSTDEVMRLFDNKEIPL